MLPLLPIPIVPEHIWKNVSEEEIKSYAAEPTDGQPVVGSGPFRFVEGTAGGSTFKFEANPDYWGGAPHIDEVDLPGLQERRTRGAGADQGRDRLRRGHHGAAGAQSLQGKPGITAQQRRLAGLRRDRVQHRLDRHQDRQADRRPQPGGAGPEVPTRARLRDRPAPADLGRSTRAPASPGTTIIPPAYPDYHWEPPADQSVHLRPRQGRPAARRGRLQEGLRRHADACRTASRSAPSGWRRAATRADVAQHHGLLQGVARRPRHRRARWRPTAPAS